MTGSVRRFCLLASSLAQFIYLSWQATLCDPMQQAMLEMRELHAVIPLKVHGHGQTHSRNFCRFKLGI